MDFPQLTMTTPDGREESIMKRTTLARLCPCCGPVRTVPTSRSGAPGHVLLRGGSPSEGMELEQRLWKRGRSPDFM